jgi:hypothetical protein
VPGQEIDPGGHAGVVLEPVTIVTTPATPVPFYDIELYGIECPVPHSNMFDRSWRGPVETTPDQRGVVPAPETTSHSQPRSLSQYRASRQARGVLGQV